MKLVRKEEEDKKFAGYKIRAGDLLICENGKAYYVTMYGSNEYDNYIFNNVQVVDISSGFVVDELPTLKEVKCIVVANENNDNEIVFEEFKITEVISADRLTLVID